MLGKLGVQKGDYRIHLTDTLVAKTVLPIDNAFYFHIYIYIYIYINI